MIVKDFKNINQLTKTPPYKVNKGENLGFHDNASFSLWHPNFYSARKGEQLEYKCYMCVERP